MANNLNSAGLNSVARSPMYLSHVRSIESGLTKEEMKCAVRAVRTALSEFYVHLPQKRSAHGTDPVQELNVLEDLVGHFRSDREFFSQVHQTLHRLFDRHTGLVLPSPWRGLVAFLPVHVESCWDQARRKLIVTKVIAGSDADGRLAPGNEITHWNGTPISVYIEKLSWMTDGANPSARIALALRSLTVRPLGYFAMPDEDWVSLSTWDGRSGGTVVLPWLVYGLSDYPRIERQADVHGGFSIFCGIDQATASVNASIRDLFLASSAERTATLFALDRAEESNLNPLRENLTFNIVKYGDKTYGYIRIYSFEHGDSVGFLTKFARILALLPDRVILDIRGNPGGTIPSGEIILQLFSKQDVEFSSLQFRNTTVCRAIANAVDYFKEWRSSMNLTVDTGEQFSQAIAITKREYFPSIQRSRVPKAVLIVDALSYSTSDYFAAGFADNQLGPIIGTDSVTGAGGANVWGYRQALEFAAQAGISSLAPLPRDMEFNLSVRRSLRVKASNGLPLEGLGASVNHRYRMTEGDVTQSNDDLVRYAASVLDTVA